MNTSETNTANMAEIDQLAETFTIACEQAVEESKTETHKAPVVRVALVLLTTNAINIPW